MIMENGLTVFSLTVNIENETIVALSDVVDIGKTPKIGDYVVGTDGYSAQIINIGSSTLLLEQSIPYALDITYLENYVDTFVTAINNRLDAGNFVKDVSLNDTNYVMTFTFENNTTKEIDLPIESMIVDVTYDDVNKELIFELDNGNTVVVPIDAIITGLASVSYVDAELAKKLDKITGTTDNKQLYAKSASGNQIMVDATVSQTSNTIALRDGNGRIKVGDAINDNHAVNKKQLDDVKDMIIEAYASFLDQPLSFFEGDTMREWFNDNQLITNGDFSNGTTGWTGVGGSLSVNNNILNMDYNGSRVDPRLSKSNPFIAGRQIYVSFESKNNGANSIGLLIYGFQTVSSTYTTTLMEYTKRSFVAIASAGTNILIRNDYPNMTDAGNSSIDVKYFLGFDVTQLKTNQQKSPMFNTTFDLMTDAQIKEQLDYWVYLYTTIKEYGEFDLILKLIGDLS